MAFAHTQDKYSAIVLHNKTQHYLLIKRSVFLKVGLSFDKQRRKGKNFDTLTTLKKILIKPKWKN